MYKRILRFLWLTIVASRSKSGESLSPSVASISDTEQVNFALSKFFTYEEKTSPSKYQFLEAGTHEFNFRIIKLDEADLLGKIGILIYHGRMVVDVSLGKKYYIETSGDAKYYFMSFFQRKRLQSGKHLILSASVSNNYFMWVCYFLPLAIRVKEYLPMEFSQITVWLGVHARQFHFDSLRALGFDKINILDGKPRKLEEVLVPNFGYLDVVDDQIGHYNILSRRSIVWLNGAFRKEGSSHRKIIVSRSLARTRRLLNEDWLVKELEGFELVHLESLTFAEQVAMFSEARVVIAPHGAGLTNLVFGRGIKVFEFYPDSRPLNNPKNLQICEYLGHEYHLMIANSTNDYQDMEVSGGQLAYIRAHLK